MTTSTMTAADLLRGAAEALRTGEIRWGRYSFIHFETGARCAAGGVAYAADPQDLDGDPRWVLRAARPAAEAAMDALAQVLIDDGTPACVDEIGDLDVIETVGGWNDEPERTVEHVIAALEAAAFLAARRDACSQCQGAGGWQQPDGLIVECPAGCMTGERAA